MANLKFKYFEQKGSQKFGGMLTMRTELMQALQALTSSPQIVDAIRQAREQGFSAQNLLGRSLKNTTRFSMEVAVASTKGDWYRIGLKNIRLIGELVKDQSHILFLCHHSRVDLLCRQKLVLR